MYQINRVLRIARAYAGVSKLEMSKRLGISSYTYADLEKGKLVPGRNVLSKISRTTGTSKEAMMLLNMSAPKELEGEYKEMFYKIQEYLIAKFVAGKWEK